MNLEIDILGLRESDYRIGAAIVDLDSTLDRFETEMAAHGEPWGGDELGVLIGDMYIAALAMAINCFNSNLDTMDAYTARLTAAADWYENAEASSVEAAAAMMRELSVPPS